MATRMQQRRGTAAEWAQDDVTLAAGEIGFETDTKQLKMGDGVTNWNALPYPFVKTRGGSLITASAVGVVPLAVQGAVGQTANLFEARDGSGAVKMRVDPAGTTLDLSANYSGSQFSSSAAASSAYIVSNGPARVPLIVKGAPSQSADLEQLQTNVGLVVGAVDYRGLRLVAPDGNVRSTNAGLEVHPLQFNLEALIIRGLAGQSADVFQTRSSSGASQMRIDNIGNVFAPGVVAGTPTGVNGALTSGTGSTGQIGLVVRGIGGQTANLAEFQNSAGTVVGGFSAVGKIIFCGTDSGAAVAGGASALPGPPVGYVTMNINGVDRRVPYWN